MISTSGLERLYSLTVAEGDVARMVAEGIETGDIADSRNVSPDTVRTQVKRILAKTGAANRAQLVRLAHSVNPPIDRLPPDSDAELPASQSPSSWKK